MRRKRKKPKKLNETKQDKQKVGEKNETKK